MQLKKVLSTALRKFNRQPLIRKVALIIAASAGTVVMGIAFFVFLVWAGLFGSLPDKAELQSIEHATATEVYSADSVLLGKYFIQERTTVPFERISPNVISALIATEDVRFFNHSGVDYKSLARVLIKSILLQNESSGGGSTITQQLAKNLFPRESHGMLSLPVNKVREALIARRLENIYSKEEILTLYLNTIPFGDNTFGIQSAAQRFFSVSAKDLSLDQAALLVGMLKATYTYNPRLFPERAQGRRNVVISQMAKYEFITSGKADSLKVQPLSLQYHRITYHTGLAPYFRAYLKEELSAWCRKNLKKDGEPYNLYTDGLKIYTTIDSRMQRYAEASITAHLKKLQAQFDRHWKGHPWTDNPKTLEDAVRNSEPYRRGKANGLSDEDIHKEMTKPRPMTVFTWAGEKDMSLSPLDSIKHYLRFLNAGLLAMESRDGAVRAWVGGIDHRYFQYDHVRKSTKRQVGSTFKPIVYAAALHQGIRPCDYVSAEKTVYTNMEGWSPRNGEENYDQKFSMAGALTYSVNTVSVRLLEQAGISSTISLARQMGIDSNLPAVPSIALGTPSISMMEMVAAYSTFINDGVPAEPYYLTAITDRHGKVLEEFAPPGEGERVLSPVHAAMIVEMLEGVVNQGTGASLRSTYGVTGDVAGKTGTTQANADGWFMAMMPGMVVGTWVGADDPRVRFRSTELGQGARTALPVFAHFYKGMAGDKELRSYTTRRFDPLPASAERELSCDMMKDDMTFFEKIFGKDEDEEEPIAERKFGEPQKVQRKPVEKKKEGFLKRLFKRRD